MLRFARMLRNRMLIGKELHSFSPIQWLESIRQDVRYALRTFRKTPIFAAVSLITLMLGIGGNTAIFTLTEAMLQRSLPVQKPDQLVSISFSRSGENGSSLSAAMFNAIRERQRIYSGMFAWRNQLADVFDNGEVRLLSVSLASGTALEVLGVHPVLGRTLTAGDDKPGGGVDGWTGVLGYDYFKSRFHGNPAILGRTLTINDNAVTIVGVLPRGFAGVEVGNTPIAVLPLEFETKMHPKYSMLRSSGTFWLTVMGRLKDGSTLAQASQELDRIGPSVLHDAVPPDTLQSNFFAGKALRAEAGGTGYLNLRSTYRQPLLFLQMLLGLILLICCANMAGLMLARSSARRREFTVRVALGASRMRLVSQLCVESGLIALAGAIAGVALATMTTGVLVRTLAGRDMALDLSPDRRVLLFVSILTVLATVVSALPSAIRATRQHRPEHFTFVRPSFTRTRVEMSLVVAQVGFSVMLVVAAGLLARSLHRLLSRDPGFSTEGVLLFPVDFSKQTRSGDERLALFEQLFRRMASLPGVQSVTSEEILALSGMWSSVGMQSILPDGSIRSDDNLHYNRIGPNYFATSGTRVIAGRDVQFSDRPGTPYVCWINQSAAVFFFPYGSAIGRVLTNGGDRPSDRCEIAGVVQDAQYTSLRERPGRILYTPFLQEPRINTTKLMLRTDKVEVVTASVRRLLHEMAPTAPVYDAITVRDQIHQSIGREQATALIAIFFGGLALLLAGVGLYGLISYEVVRQTREIGTRIALGATRANVLQFIMSRGAGMTSIGLLIGLTMAFPLARLLTGLLFEIKPNDPVTYVFAGSVLFFSAMLASYLPARRAAGVDPMVALRSE